VGQCVIGAKGLIGANGPVDDCALVFVDNVAVAIAAAQKMANVVLIGRMMRFAGVLNGSLGAACAAP
jgi:hypothetical protein